MTETMVTVRDTVESIRRTVETVKEIMLIANTMKGTPRDLITTAIKESVQVSGSGGNTRNVGEVKARESVHID